MMVNFRENRCKTLIISETVPPMVQGPAIMLRNLLKEFPEGSYCVLTKEINWRGKLDESSRLPCTYYYVDRAYSSYKTKLHRLLSQILEQLWIFKIVFKGLQIVKREHINNIIAFNNEGDLLIASYILHKITKRPLFLYMLDVYEEMIRVRIRKIIASMFEEKIFRAARKIFVMSENLQAHYLNKYSIHTEFMPHPVVLSSYQGQVKEDKKDDCKTIIYTGNVWIPQIESLVDMCRVVGSMKGIKFIVYTDRSAEELKQKGICGKNVFVRFAEHSQISEIQRNADILYLPLAFNTPFPLMIQTASPGKMPEYLAAGRPILIYAPDYSYVVQHARKYGFGFVIDKQSVEELRKGIMFLLNDGQLREGLVSKAKALSKNHNATIVSKKLRTALICES